MHNAPNLAHQELQEFVFKIEKKECSLNINLAVQGAMYIHLSRWNIFEYNMHMSIYKYSFLKEKPFFEGV